MPEDDSDREALRLDLLKRIAETLEMPTSTLYGSEKAVVDRPDPALREAVQAMLSAFVRIRDPKRRRACLDYVTALANGDAGPLDDRGPDRNDR